MLSKAATNAGLTLSAPYDTDINGVIRSVDGVWDRGAFEFASGVDRTRPTRLEFIRIQ